MILVLKIPHTLKHIITLKCVLKCAVMVYFVDAMMTLVEKLKIEVTPYPHSYVAWGG